MSLENIASRVWKRGGDKSWQHVLPGFQWLRLVYSIDMGTL